MSNIARWLIQDESRARAKIKYEQKQLEVRLATCSQRTNNHNEIKKLRDKLSQKYLEYLRLIDSTLSFELIEPDTSMSWEEQHSLIQQLKLELNQSIKPSKKCDIIKKIASLYYYCADEPAINVDKNTANIKNLLKNPERENWLISMVDFCNENHTISSLFFNWSSQELQTALNFFSESKVINLVNALFFYKLYPDKLFKDLIHPEKLISIRTRIGVLHQCIESIVRQLQRAASQKGLVSEVDYLFHGSELPKGIIIEGCDTYTESIQQAIKALNLKYTHENEEQITIERLQELILSYKFWFNPNRLIDTVMILNQRLIKNDIAEENKLLAFFQKMVLSYKQLSTTHCLDLYGYFANNDTRYLIYTLSAIAKGQSFEWLPVLKVVEKNAITKVFQVLRSAMDALREALKYRQITTQPYNFELTKEHFYTRRRIRDAVSRIIAIYGNKIITKNNKVDELFSLIERDNKRS